MTLSEPMPLDAAVDAAGVPGYDAWLRVVGTGRLLVYVPGMDGTGELFYKQIPRLSRRYRVATYRLRDDAPDMATLVEDLARVIRLVGGGEPAVLVAESFGGALSMSFALAHPGLVRALVLLNTFPYFKPQRRLRAGILGTRLLPSWSAMRLVRRLTAFRLHSRFTHRAEVRRFLELTALSTRAGYLSRLRILRRYDVRERLRDITHPTLLLAATEDHLIPSVEQAHLMASRLPNATMKVLEGHGHSCFLAASLDLAELLTEWEGERQQIGARLTAC
jgi:pimeloyl-ACP methyl ester carboxylesterase